MTTNSQADFRYLDKRIMNYVKDNPGESLKSLRRKIRRDVEVDVSIHKVYRAKQHAIDLLKGDIKEQYNRLYDYCETVCKHNPGSSCVLKVDRELTPPILQRMYVCLKPLSDGFKVVCRPIIGLDGCFLKGLYKGQLLTATTMDENNNIYPIAMAFVEVEKFDSWDWFLNLLFRDIGEAREGKWSFLSDRQKGPIEALGKHAPDVEHHFCLRHMYNNFKMKFKGLELKRLFWKAASTYNINEHKRTMKEILKCNPKVNENKNAFEWLSDIPEHQWARSYFPTRTKCDVLVNNTSESFNHYIMAARDLPIIEMFEWIRRKSMTRIQIKREGMEKYDGSICPNIVKKIEVQRKESRNCFPSWAGEDKFEIMHLQSNHVIHLKSKSCTCGMFQLVGYPCCHAIAALDMHRQDPLEFVDVYFSKQMYLYLYSHIISPVPGMHDFEKSSLGIVNPPIIKK
ncbi:uncharacterized protein LOC127264402 [Andrographis paniculata]|uniref:uncharacterized protein LOC127264402 n=1 Tax=Andrographis paniculata TaxID=175694 RepID=UPI0021E9A10C|nr:uncharacterized protein LOC127264402 [Andrographis paniculata]